MDYQLDEKWKHTHTHVDLSNNSQQSAWHINNSLLALLQLNG